MLYLLRKSSCSADIFILNISSPKKVAVLKRSYPKEQPTLKKSLLGGSSAKVATEKIPAAKKSFFEKGPP